MDREITGWFLMSEGFQTVGIVIISAVTCMLAKVAGRNDRYKTNYWNDLAFGVDIFITAIIIGISRSISALSLAYKLRDQNSSTIDFTNEVSYYFWLVFMSTLGLGALILIVRKLGWKNRNDLHWFWGILVPDVTGAAALYIVINF